MRQSAVVAGRQHAVVLGQGGEPAGDVLGIVDAQVAERRRQAVGTMLGRGTAQDRERGREAGGERGVALAAEHHLAMLEAGVDQREVVEAMSEGLPGDEHAQTVHIGKVRQAHPTRRVHLREHHRALGAMHRAPGPDPPLERTPHALADPVGMTTGELAQDRDRAQSRRLRQHRHDLFVPDARQRIGPGPIGAALLA